MKWAVFFGWEKTGGDIGGEKEMVVKWVLATST